MHTKQSFSKNFILALISICCFYLLFEFFFNTYSMISVDEFWYAHQAYQYKEALPYRDFSPYKTILGYYFLLIPMLISHGIIPTLVLTKNLIAILNTLILFFSAFYLTRFFAKKAVLGCLLTLVATDIVLSFSTNIRVDLFSYWFCFFSLLLVLNKRFTWAGFCIGLGFITSQKAIWYIFASNGTFLMYLLAIKNHSALKITIKNILYFNLALILVIFSYLAIWSYVSHWQTVLQSLFNEAFAIYQLDTYAEARKLYWTYTLLYNPLLFLLWPLTLLSIFITYPNDASYPYRFFIVIYAFFILLCLIPYKQVFPYYMQVTIPLFLSLYTAFFSWMIGFFRADTQLTFKWIDKNSLIFLLCCYVFSVCYLDWTFTLPIAYLFICLIPFSFLLRLTKKMISPISESISLKIAILTCFFVGIIYPLCLYTFKVIQLNGDYQKENLNIATDLLKDHSYYLAGIELFYNQKQPIAGLRHLMAPAVKYLYSPTPELKKVMLASLYEDPHATVSTVMNALSESPIKFYINNYRMKALPKPILDILNKEFIHFWGSIYLYAPTIQSGMQKVRLKFSGKYFIESHSNIDLNGKKYAAHTIASLTKGIYLSRADKDYRLRLVPAKLTHPLVPTFRQDAWEKIIF